MSGMSGNSTSISYPPSSPSRRGRAPRAAEGGLRRALGRRASPGSTRLEEILGEQSGLGAAAGVLGVEVRNVLTITGSGDPKLPMVAIAGGGVLIPARLPSASRF